MSAAIRESSRGIYSLAIVLQLSDFSRNSQRDRSVKITNTGIPVISIGISLWKIVGVSREKYYQSPSISRE